MNTRRTQLAIWAALAALVVAVSAENALAGVRVRARYRSGSGRFYVRGAYSSGGYYRGGRRGYYGGRRGYYHAGRRYYGRYGRGYRYGRSFLRLGYYGSLLCSGGGYCYDSDTTTYYTSPHIGYGYTSGAYYRRGYYGYGYGYRNRYRRYRSRRHRPFPVYSRRY